MPIYEYECKECGERFEHRHAESGTRDIAPPCPRCGKKGANRTLSSFSVGKTTAFTGGGKTCCGVSSPSEAGCGGGACCGKGR